MASNAEALIFSKLASLQARAEKLSHGREKMAVIEICRALDLFAAIELIHAQPSRDYSVDAYFAQRGAAAALQPFLSAIEADAGGLSWHGTRQKTADFFYCYLVQCGQLVDLARLARLEKYGLATTEAHAGRIDIHVRSDSRERTARKLSLDKIATSSAPLPIPRNLRRRMYRYVKPCKSFFIKYDNDFDIVDEYMERARKYGQSFLEAEALPDDFVIGGRPFIAWKRACEQALGRILAHIDFAFLLCKKRPETNLRDVITMFSRKEDTASVWVEAGLAPGDVDPTMRALTLRAHDLSGWISSFEVPTSPYIDLGTNFVLLPAFGVLINPYFSLFRHLRSVYRSDWDRGVNQREGMFRSDLAKLFPNPKFLMPSHGFKIKRNDGSHLTDIDAVICDKETGALALVQLKWHDAYGRSLSERESRRRNLARATEWVSRLSQWIDGRTAREISQALGLNSVCNESAPELYVVARYSAQFVGDERKNGDATWLSWPELVALKEDTESVDPISDIPKLAAAMEKGVVAADGFTTTYEFPDLIVSVHAEA